MLLRKTFSIRYTKHRYIKASMRPQRVAAEDPANEGYTFTLLGSLQ